MPSKMSKGQFWEILAYSNENKLDHTDYMAKLKQNVQQKKKKEDKEECIPIIPLT